MASKNHCHTCDKGGIIMRCDRCQQTFCNEHIIKHRQQSSQQLDGIMEEHDVIQEELKHSSNKHSLLKTIEKWEKDSIGKIQTAAETARIELRQMVETAKERLSHMCHDIVGNLRSARDHEQFCENDLIRSMNQLKQLKTKIDSPLSVRLIEDQTSAIRLITVQGTDFLNREFEKKKVYSVVNRTPTSDVQERFSKIIGPAITSEGALLAKHTGTTSAVAYLLGEECYSQGRQTIRFKIEQSQTPYNIFFGCISSATTSNAIHCNSASVAGWFGSNEVHQHGTCNQNVEMHGYDSRKIETYDVVSLTFNCDEQQIEFYPERTKKIHELPIDMAKAPFPWQLLLILTHKHDSVRILHNV